MFVVLGSQYFVWDPIFFSNIFSMTVFFLWSQIAYQIAPRRSGDVASCYADPSLAEKELGWKAEFGLERMCKCKLKSFLLCSLHK